MAFFMIIATCRASSRTPSPPLPLRLTTVSACYSFFVSVLFFHMTRNPHAHTWCDCAGFLRSAPMYLPDTSQLHAAEGARRLCRHAARAAASAPVQGADEQAAGAGSCQPEPRAAGRPTQPGMCGSGLLMCTNRGAFFVLQTYERARQLQPGC